MYATILNTTGVYNDKETELFNVEVKKRFIEKDGIVMHSGEIAKSVYFLLSGSIYQVSQSPMQSTITNLHIKNDWFLNQESLVLQRPSEQQIIAFSDSVVLEISIESVHYLIAKSTAFLQLNAILFDKVTSDLHKSLRTPLEKYQYILDHKPDIIQKFPLKMIASYLQITAETLSRVRNTLVRSHS
jgi:CRP-like cAMP-binding protein